MNTYRKKRKPTKRRSSTETVIDRCEVIERRPDGSRVIKMSSKMQDLMRAQLDAFKNKFGREPEGDDPVFFDPDKDVPTPMSAQSIGDGLLRAARRAGIPPDKIYAMEKTQRLVTEENVHMLTDDERQEWLDAIDEYHRLHGSP